MGELAEIHQKLKFIYQNPVEEGLVFRAEEYVYISANDFAGGNDFLDIWLIKWYEYGMYYR